MLLLAFLWPNTLLVTTLAVLLVSSFVPRLDVVRRHNLMIILPATLATILWQSYEFRLDQLAPAGDPLIRIDLFVIYPLLCLTWGSAIITLVANLARRPSASNPA